MKDQLYRTFQLKNTPKRIVSLVPSQTELLYDLGLEHAIVGITKFCVHPNHLLKTKAIVGGTKQIKIDEIKALKPDVILCNKEENTQEIVAVCENICPVHVSDIMTIDDCLELIKQYGTIFKVENQALKIVETIQLHLKDFKVFIQNKSVLKTAYFIWRSPWMVAGKQTFINAMLNLNKLENFYNNKVRYPEIDLEDADNIDVILLSSEPYPFKNKHIEELKTYYPNANILLVDGEMFSWYGSRLIQSFDYFKSLRLNFL